MPLLLSSAKLRGVYRDRYEALLKSSGTRSDYYAIHQMNGDRTVVSRIVGVEMDRLWTIVLVVLLFGVLEGCAVRDGARVHYFEAEQLPTQWRTRAERSNYEETGRYLEVVDFCRRLANHTYAQYETFGVSGEGRELLLLILSQDCPLSARRAPDGKLRVLLQNCIHPGECAGKDASLELARDILITGRHKHLLDEVDLLIMPIFSPDGHERFSPYSRINQNGPKEMGWRVTATNLNLNRDYTKADAIEMQSWLRFWRAWQPDLFFDNHTTNGSDHQYDLFYATTVGPAVDPAITGWLEERLLPTVLPELVDDGHLTLEYSFPRNRADLLKGINAAIAFSPRYSTGYSVICDRPSLLVEVHAHKSYGQRVRATYDIMLHTLEELNRNPDQLRAAIHAAEVRCIKTRGAGLDGRIALTVSRGDDSRPITYKALAATVRSSHITGGDVIEYGEQPLDVETRLFHESRVEKAVIPPAAYLVPPQWKEVIKRLELHGVEFFRLPRSERLEVETYRFENVEFPERPYEGRFQPRYETVAGCATWNFPAGTAVVSMNQPRAKVAAHLLEPEAPDSLVAWGLLNAIFERKEYAESYIMEPIARRMLMDDSALKQEFEEQLQNDESFANNPGARLDFFYQRSPYWDAAFNVYPVARLMDQTILDRVE